MVLIECTECNHSISDKANACPQCGHPVSPEPSDFAPTSAPSSNSQAPRPPKFKDYGKHFAFKVNTTDFGREFSIRGSGIGPGRFIVLVIIFVMIGLILAGIQGNFAAGFTFAVPGFIFASLLTLYRLRTQTFTLTPDGIVKGKSFYSYSDISELFVFNKLAGGDVFSAQQGRSGFFVAGTGVAGMGLAAGAALSNAASAFGSDLRRLSDGSRIKRENHLCIRYGARKIPLAKFLSEDKSVALFEAVAEEQAELIRIEPSNDIFKPVSGTSVVSMTEMYNPVKLSAKGTVLKYVGYFVLGLMALGRVSVLVHALDPQLHETLRPAISLLPFALLYLSIHLALVLRELPVIARVGLVISMAIYTFIGLHGLWALGPVFFWGTLLWGMGGKSDFDKIPLCALIVTKLIHLSLGLGFYATLANNGFDVTSTVIGPISFFTLLTYVEVIALLALIPCFFRQLARPVSLPQKAAETVPA